MIEYITEIQRQFIENYGIEKGRNGCPVHVPDGSYPMMIGGDLDLVLIRDGKINCCNFIAKEDGLAKFQKLMAHNLLLAKPE